MDVFDKSRSSLKVARDGTVIVSLMFCALGIWLLVDPMRALDLICILAGVLLIIAGGFKLVGYFSKDFYCLAFQFDLAFGSLLAATGIILITRRSLFEALIFVVLGILILADSLFKIQIALDARRFGLSSEWWKLMVTALGTGVLGTLLVISPSDGTRFMLTLAGVALIAEGAMNLFVSLFMVKTFKNGFEG